ncbi:flagellar filament capping protein FliD [Sporanaerobacter acetigenes]|uniref:Flagellar hook-associated protein 2 n=1 Tax=Sporanaerobacter acetigenes DSM 13106 TaxID=1123281 RepID=A0A1M5SF49_9FIRM|nr:flagellar filament capping protein FliD [Sporanaerobacter acetigenes]SHH37184.1 flagellar hook-associated protein 2 [Sporanaerobacter acetigenes DSM 13106]
MYNNLRITGLASGMDTEEMIKGLMEAEKVRLNRVEQDKQLLVWKREIYNDLNKDYANFILKSRKNFGLTTTTSTGAFVSRSYENLTWVKKATSSDETIATVSSTSKAMNGNYEMEVKQLAEGVKAVSGEKVTVENGNNENLASQFELGNDAIIKFTIETKNGIKTFKFGNVEDADIKKSLNEISLNDVVKTINSAKVKDGEKEVSLGLKANYDANIDRFFLQTEDTGVGSKLKISADVDSYGKAFIDALNLNVNGAKYNIGDEKTGKSAVVNFDGAENIIMDSNQFTINGIDFNLKSIGAFTTTIGTDIDAFYDKIKQFVDDYNELVEKTSKLLTDKRYGDYKPLTADQKKAMEKEDIELWEEKAKSGLLRSDDLLSRTMQNSRTWMYNEVKDVEGSFNRLFQIGIDTEKYSRGVIGGKLVIDEVKLKDAIRKDPNGVLELFFKEPEYGKDKLKGVTSYMSEKDLSGEQIRAKRQQSGVVTRLYDNLISGMQDIIEKSGTGEDSNIYRNVKSNMLIEFVTKHGSISTIDKDVLQLEKRIDDLNDYLIRKENSYYSQFAAMEKAISRMNQQSMWLMQQFSSK